MSHQVLSATWAYLYKVLWNWAGILLAIDAVVALAERYLGEVVERVFHRKPRIPVRYKLGFAAAVLVVAQAVAYHDLQGELDQSNHNNDELRSAVSMKDQKIGVQEQEIKDLRSAPPKVIYRKSDAGGDSKRADALKRTIQGRLTAYINAGLSLGNDWTKRLGGTEEVQRQSALAIQGWHKAVEDYLKTIPRGNIYLVRFQNRLRASGSYPTGINLNLAGNWDLLESDLARLNEFLTDPDLGKP